MIKNSNIIITGATSGIGYVLAKKLSKNNKIIAIGRDSKELNALKKAIGKNHLFLKIDLTQPETIYENLSFIDMPINGFVHCAGIESVIFHGFVTLIKNLLIL